MSAEPGPAVRARRGRSGGQLAIAGTVALLGFLLATQLQVRQGLGQRLAAEREPDLARILSDLSVRSDRLLEEIVDLRLRLASAAGSAQQEKALVDDARGELEGLQVMLGLVAVQGEGIVVTIRDPSGSVGPEALLDAIQELRDAGAEAIEINGVRVVASVAVAGEVGAITLDARGIRAPYRIVAIGARDTLGEAMRIPGGVVDSVRAREAASIDVERLTRVTIASLHRTPTFSYARAGKRR